MTNYLTIKTASELAGVSTKTIRRYVNSGALVSKTVRGKRGMEYRILKSSLIQHLRRMGYGSPVEPDSPPDEGEILVRLRHLVPRYLFDDFKKNYDLLLLERGKLQGQLERAEQEVAAFKKENQELQRQLQPLAVLQNKAQQLDQVQQKVETLEKKNVELLQAMAEKDTLISILEHQNSKK